MPVVVFIVGVLVGIIVTILIIAITSGHGQFIISPYDEDDTGFYTVNVKMDTSSDLLKKKRVILKVSLKDSQK